MENFVAVDDSGNQVPLQVVRSGDNLVIFLNEGQTIEGVTEALQGATDGGQGQYQIMVTDNYTEGQQLQNVEQIEGYDQQIQEVQAVQEGQPGFDVQQVEEYSAEAFQEIQAAGETQLLQDVQQVADGQVQQLNDTQQFLETEPMEVDQQYQEGQQIQLQEGQQIHLQEGQTFHQIQEGQVQVYQEDNQIQEGQQIHAQDGQTFHHVQGQAQVYQEENQIQEGQQFQDPQQFQEVQQYQDNQQFRSQVIQDGQQIPEVGTGEQVQQFTETEQIADGQLIQTSQPDQEVQTSETVVPASTDTTFVSVFASGSESEGVNAFVSAVASGFQDPSTTHNIGDIPGVNIPIDSNFSLPVSQYVQGNASGVESTVKTSEMVDRRLEIDLPVNQLQTTTLDNGTIESLITESYTRTAAPTEIVVTVPKVTGNMATGTTQDDRITAMVELPSVMQTKTNTIAAGVSPKTVIQSTVPSLMKTPGSREAVSILLKCEKCDQVFFTASELRAHREKMHPQLTMKDRTSGVMSSAIDFQSLSSPKYTSLLGSSSPKTSSQGVGTETNKNVCPLCYIICSSIQALMKHKHEKHGIALPFKCALCNYSSSQKRYLDTHMRLHQKSYQCKICQIHFDTEEKVNKHMNTHSKDKYQCFYCSKMYLTRKACTDHIAAKHSASQITTAEEEKKETSTTTQIPESQAPAQTENVESPVGNTDHLEKDQATQMSDESKKTEIPLTESKGVGPSYTDEQNQAVDAIAEDNSQMEVEEAEDDYPDEEEFDKMNGELKLEQEAKTDPQNPPQGLEDYTPIKNRDFQCLVCLAEFSTEYLFQNHTMKEHTTGNTCHACGRVFSKRGLLRPHFQEAHCCKDVYKCKNCDRVFNMVQKFWRHAQVHARRYVCSKCDKAFSLPYELKRHEVEVHQMKTYFCVYCPESFTTPGDLRKHKNDVHNMKSYIHSKSKDNEAVKKEPSQDAKPQNVQKKEGVATASTLIKQAKDSGSQMTIKIFGDGTYMTTDPNTGNADYGTIDLSNLGLDPALLQSHNDLELVIIPPGKDSEGNTATSEDKKPFNVETVTPSPLKLKTEQGDASAANSSGRSYSCKYCPRTFRFFRHLRCHENAHNREDKYECHICKRMFVRETNLKLHLELHAKKENKMSNASKPSTKSSTKSPRPPKPKVAKPCDICGKIFMDTSKLTRHIRQVHDQCTTVECQVCQKSFKSESNFQRHMKTHYGPFACTYCDEIFKVKEELNEHVKELHQQRLHTCKVCNAEYFSFGKLMSHMKNMHSEDKQTVKEAIKSISCDICHKQFSNQKNVRIHRLTHTGEKKYHCLYCPWKFYTAWKLKKHTDSIHINAEKRNRFPCDMCMKEYQKQEHLERHEKLLHRGPFHCPFCTNEIFDDKETFKKHCDDLHSGNSAKCTTCEQQFSCGRHLQIHEYQAHPKTSLCDLCGYSFTRRDEMLEHMKTNHFDGDEEKMKEAYPNVDVSIKTDSEELRKTLSCTKCGKKTKTYTGLILHMKTCENSKETHKVEADKEELNNTVCAGCGKKTKTHNGLLAHMKFCKRSAGDNTDEETKFSPSPKRRKEAKPPLSPEKHAEMMELKKNPKCKTCGRTFQNYAAALSHMRYCLKNLERTSKKLKVKIEKCPTPVKKEKRENNEEEYYPFSYLKTNNYHTCDICQKTFNKRSSLRQHLLVHAGIKQVENSKNKTDMANIAKKQPNEKEAQSKSNEDTESEHYDLNKLQCKICNIKFKAPFSLKRHIHNKHPGVKYTDRTNATGLKVKKEIKSERKTEEELSQLAKNQFLEMNFSLGIKTEPSSSLMSPVLETVKTKRHYCKLCGLKFSREATLNKHLSEVHSEEESIPDSDMSDIMQINTTNTRIKTREKAKSDAEKDKMRDGSTIPKNKIKTEDQKIKSKDQKVKTDGGSTIPKTKIKTENQKIKSKDQQVKTDGGSTIPKTKIKAEDQKIKSKDKGKNKQIKTLQKGAKQPLISEKRLLRNSTEQKLQSVKSKWRHTHKEVQGLGTNLTSVRNLRNKGLFYNLRVKKKLTTFQKPITKKVQHKPVLSNSKQNLLKSDSSQKSVKEVQKKGNEEIHKRNVKKPNSNEEMHKRNDKSIKKPNKEVPTKLRSSSNKEQKQTHKIQKSVSKSDSEKKKTKSVLPEKPKGVIPEKKEIKTKSQPNRAKSTSSTSALGGVFTKFLKKRIKSIKYKCEFCNGQFSEKVSLNSHIRIKHASKANCKSICICSICGEMFTDIRSLLYHFKSKHSEIDLFTYKLLSGGRSKIQSGTSSNEVLKEDSNNPVAGDFLGNSTLDGIKDETRKEDSELIEREEFPFNDQILTESRELERPEQSVINDSENICKSGISAEMQEKESVGLSLSSNVLETEMNTIIKEEVHQEDPENCAVSVREAFVNYTAEENESRLDFECKMETGMSEEDMEVEPGSQDFKSPVVHDVDMFSGNIVNKNKVSDMTETSEVNDLLDMKQDLLLGDQYPIADSKNVSKGMKTNSVTSDSNGGECQICLKKFYTETGYKRHVLCHTNKNYVCKECDASFRWKTNYESHWKMFHSNCNVLVCISCNNILFDKSEMERHQVTHLVKKFSCFVCKKRFSKYSILKSHVDEVHKTSKLNAAENLKDGITCISCNIDCGSTEHLINHLLVLHPPNNSAKLLFRDRIYKFKCKFCPLIFKSSESLSSHVKVCDKRALLAKKLRGFELTDNTCSVCGMKFMNKPNRYKHMQTYHGNGSKFQCIDLLKTPAMVKRYSCKNCNGIFAKFSSYIMHEKTFYGICSKKKKSLKHEQCPFCKVFFGSHLTLGKHMLKAHNYNLYYSWKCCPYCDQSFARRLNLKKHLQKIHPQVAKPQKLNVERKAEKRRHSVAVALDQQVIKSLVTPKPESSKKDQVENRYKKVRPSSGIEKHKCDYCGRVHWTLDAYEVHLSKYHPDRWIEKSQDSPGIANSPAVNTAEVLDHTIEDNKLSAFPVVLVQRLPVDLLLKSSESHVAAVKEGTDKYLGLPYRFDAADMNEGEADKLPVDEVQDIKDIPLLTDSGDIPNLPDLPLEQQTVCETKPIIDTETSEVENGQYTNDVIVALPSTEKIAAPTIALPESLPDEILETSEDKSGASLWNKNDVDNIEPSDMLQVSKTDEQILATGSEVVNSELTNEQSVEFSEPHSDGQEISSEVVNSKMTNEQSVEFSEPHSERQKISSEVVNSELTNEQTVEFSEPLSNGQEISSEVVNSELTNEQSVEFNEPLSDGQEISSEVVNIELTNQQSVEFSEPLSDGQEISSEVVNRELTNEQSVDFSESHFDGQEISSEVVNRELTNEQSVDFSESHFDGQEISSEVVNRELTNEQSVEFSEPLSDVQEISSEVVNRELTNEQSVDFSESHFDGQEISSEVVNSELTNEQSDDFSEPHFDGQEISPQAEEALPEKSDDIELMEFEESIENSSFQQDSGDKNVKATCSDDSGDGNLEEERNDAADVNIESMLVDGEAQVEVIASQDEIDNEQNEQNGNEIDTLMVESEVKISESSEWENQTEIN